MIQTHGPVSEDDTVAYKSPKNVGKLHVGGDNYELIPISAEMKDWVEATDLKFEHLYQQINLLQKQVQKVSLGFTVSVPNIKDLGDIKIDSITKDISHDIVIDPNPPKLYEEVAPSDLNSVDINTLVELLSTCSQMVCAVESLYPYPDFQSRSGISAIDLRKKIADMIYELTHQWKPYTYMGAHNVSKSYTDRFFIDDIVKHLTSYAEVLRRDIKSCSDSSVAKHDMIDELAEVNGLLQKLKGVQDRGI